MNEQTQEKYIQIPASELDKLLANCDGNAALLYLFARRTGELSLHRAAMKLKCTEAELQTAAASLRAQGLVDDAERSLERSSAPAYDSEDVAARMESDPEFSAVTKEAAKVLGRLLSSNDLALLMGIYDYWGLPADVMMVLLHYCVERCQLRYGPGRMPTLHSIEQTAMLWAKNEIVTLDAAEEYLRREAERREQTAQVKEILQIWGRNLTAGERKYIEDWLGKGFSPEAIAIAYERTVMATGNRTWKYMDKIIASWDGQGLYTPEAIESGDQRPWGTEKRARASRTPVKDGSEDEKLEAMRRMYAHMKGT
ncbi:MAG: DnaD domain protein [Oscillospiraceae bacterium]|nr:DnaD domain protein [Oscillospiraceae bacterium]